MTNIWFNVRIGKTEEKKLKLASSGPLNVQYLPSIKDVYGECVDVC